MSQTALHDRVMAAFATVRDPELHKDLVSLGMVQDLRVEDGVVSVRIDLTTPACPLKEKIETDVRAAILAVPGVRDLRLTWGAQVRSVGRPRISFPAQHGGRRLRQGRKVDCGGQPRARSPATAPLSASHADIYGPNQPTMLGGSGRPQGTRTRSSRRGPVRRRLISTGFLPDEPVIWRARCCMARCGSFSRRRLGGSTT
jgi:ATP-binding protein involved in chromosome partitioning